eukprot:GGOE01024821.1.p1 GENE.GGOE01024821.1~~GGOE01024821.1.p1  ORF type:complete len:329 (-),score=-14.55 GGOE01024821.1:523-1509(-)
MSHPFLLRQSVPLGVWTPSPEGCLAKASEAPLFPSPAVDPWSPRLLRGPSWHPLARSLHRLTTDPGPSRLPQCYSWTDLRWLLSPPASLRKAFPTPAFPRIFVHSPVSSSRATPTCGHSRWTFTLPPPCCPEFGHSLPTTGGKLDSLSAAFSTLGCGVYCIACQRRRPAMFSPGDLLWRTPPRFPWPTLCGHPMRALPSPPLHSPTPQHHTPHTLHTKGSHMPASLGLCWQSAVQHDPPTPRPSLPPPHSGPIPPSSPRLCLLTLPQQSPGLPPAHMTSPYLCSQPLRVGAASVWRAGTALPCVRPSRNTPRRPAYPASPPPSDCVAA